MSEEYSTFTLFQALSLSLNTKADAVRSISTDTPEIHLDYCIPKKFTKKITDISAAESDEQIGPDTGPSGQFVEMMITIERKGSDQQETLQTLLQWQGIINTALPFRRGFLGLENADNPSLDLDPVLILGYKIVDFHQINPVSNKGKIQYVILLELQGGTTELPVFGP